MRRLALATLALAVATATSSPAGAQDPVCTHPFGADIGTVAWSVIQTELTRLDQADAFDKHPLVSDRQSIVLRGKSGKNPKSMALIAARRGVHTATEAQLEAGCFVGTMESEGHEETVAAFKGKTFMWVDKQGPEEQPWRIFHFPLDESSPPSAAEQIAGPFLVPDSGQAAMMGGLGSFAESPSIHVYFRGQLLRGNLTPFSAQDLRGGYWLTKPLKPISQPTPFAPWLSLMAPPADDAEVMGCVICDGTTCCPTFMTLSIG